MLKRKINLGDLREKLLKSLIASLLMASIYKLITCKKYISAFAVSFILVCSLVNEYNEYKREKEIIEDLSENNSGFI